MSKDDKYFQFPVAALQICKPLQEVCKQEVVRRLSEIVGFAVIEAGKSFVEKKTPEAVEAVLQRSKALRPNRTNPSVHEKMVITGMDVCNVEFTDGVYAKQDSYVEEWQHISNLSGGDKVVRLRTDLYWSYRNGSNDWSWRDFATLCGVFAGIGSAASKRLSYDYIGCLSAGYSSFEKAKAANAILPETHITRYTVRRLADKGLFTYLSPDRRHNYYSKSLTPDKLVTEIVEQERNTRKKARDTANRLLQERIASLDPKPKARKKNDDEKARKQVLDALRQSAQ